MIKIKINILKNHTEESRLKASKTIQEQYNNGRKVWNKNIKEKDNDSVKKQADNLRLNHHNNGFGEYSSRWNGGATKHKKARIKKEELISCELCGSKTKLEVHHKDKNINNNNDSNLIKVCCKCHNLLHHGWHVGTKAINDKIKSIKYVGSEETYDIEMKHPYHNYIANGFIVHNSTRYCNYNNKDHINL